MNLLSSLNYLISLTIIKQFVLIGTVTSTLTPDKLEFSAAFPPENQFGLVFNGQSNKILLKISNLGRDPVEDVMRIHQVWNEFREIGGKERLIRKGVPVPSKRNLPPKPDPYIIPFLFHAEEKEGNIGLRIWVEWSGPKGKKYQAMAYDSTITIQEPPTRWFDPQLILLYIILLSTFGGIGYIIYGSYVVPNKSTRSMKAKRSGDGPNLKTPKVSTPTGGTYEEEWIPAGHSVRPSKKSGTESGGGEGSGTEEKARRRKR